MRFPRLPHQLEESDFAPYHHARFGPMPLSDWLCHWFSGFGDDTIDELCCRVIDHCRQIVTDDDGLDWSDLRAVEAELTAEQMCRVWKSVLGISHRNAMRA